VSGVKLPTSLINVHVCVVELILKQAAVLSQDARQSSAALAYGNAARWSALAGVRERTVPE